MAEFIQKTDTLNEGREKLNVAIQDAEDAKTTARQAVNVSEQAKQIAQTAENKADNVQEQFNQVVIEGDSSVEAAQARVTEDGKVFNTLRDRLNYTDTQLIQTATDISDRGLNVKNYFNLKGNGTEDITPYLIEALSLSNHVIIPRSSVFYLSGELEIPEGKTIDFNKSLLVFDNENSCINVSPNTVLKNLRVQVNGNVQLKKSVLYFDGNKKFPFGHNTRTNLENIYIEQQFGDAAYENTLIWFDATQKTTDRCFISGVTIKNISSMRGKFGIRNTVKQYSEDSPRPYITGNNIDGYIAYNPVNFIWDDDIVGDGEITGNFYNNVQCQPADNQEKVFYRLVGNGNKVTGKFWDVSRPSNQTDQFIILGNDNYIQAGQPAMPSDYIRNEGRYNTIIGGFPSAPAIHTHELYVERQVKKLYKGLSKPLPFLLERSESKVQSNKETDGNATVLFEEEINPNDIPTSYTTITVKGMGVRVNPSRSYFGTRLDGEYLTGETTSDISSSVFWVEVKFSLRKYTDRISLKVFLKVEASSVIQYRETTIRDLDKPFNISVHFSSPDNEGDMTLKYVEAIMTIG